MKFTRKPISTITLLTFSLLSLQPLPTNALTPSIAWADIEPDEAILRIHSFTDEPDPFSPNGDGRRDTVTLSATVAFRPDDPEGVNPTEEDFTEELSEDREEILEDLEEFFEDTPEEVGLIRMNWILQDPTTQQTLKTLIQNHPIQPPFTLDVLSTTGSNVGHFLVVTLNQIWDGQDSQGVLLADGVYPYAVQTSLIEREQEDDDPSELEEEILLLSLVASGTITLDTTPPVITDLTPVNGVTLDTPRPTISALFNDTLSGIDLSSIHLTLDGVDVTSNTQISETSIRFESTSDLSGGSHTTLFIVSDRAGNFAQASVHFTVSLGPPITPTSGFIHGEVFDAKTGLPLENASISADGILGRILSEADGHFTYPTPSPGEFILMIEKENYTVAQRRVNVVKTRDVAVAPAHLTPLDPIVTPVGPSGGTATSSDGMVSLVIPPGALLEDVPIRLTEITSSNGLPAPFPEGTGFAHALDIQPDGVTLSEPALLRIVNAPGFAPGTPIPIALYNMETLLWEDFGMATVSPDGAFVEIPINHFSHFGCPPTAPPPPTARPPTGPKKHHSAPEDRTAPAKDVTRGCSLPIGSQVGLHDGALRVEYDLPSVRRLGESQALTFIYESDTVKPLALIDTETLIDPTSVPGGEPGTLVPVTAGVTVQIEGTQEEVKFIGTEGAATQRFLWDGINGRGGGCFHRKLPLYRDTLSRL